MFKKKLLIYKTWYHCKINETPPLKFLKLLFTSWLHFIVLIDSILKWQNSKIRLMILWQSGNDKRPVFNIKLVYSAGSLKRPLVVWLEQGASKTESGFSSPGLSSFCKLCLCQHWGTVLHTQSRKSWVRFHLKEHHKTYIALALYKS